MSEEQSTESTVTVEQLIGPLTAALAPQLISLIENKISNEISAKASTSVHSSATSGGCGSSHQSHKLKEKEINKNDSGQGTGNDQAGQGTAIGGNNPNFDESYYDEYEDYDDGEIHSEEDYGDNNEIEMVDPLSSYMGEDGPWTPAPQTQKYLDEYMRRLLGDKERKAILDNFPLPDGPAVRAPKIDAPVFTLLKKRHISVKDIPGFTGLEAIQKRLLESLGPLAAVHSACYDAMKEKYLLNPEKVLEAVSNAISLVGSANAQSVIERRKVVLWMLAPELVRLSSGVEITNSDELLGKDIWKDMNGCVEVESKVNDIVKKSKYSMSDRSNGSSSSSGRGGRGGGRFRGGSYFRGGGVKRPHPNTYNNNNNYYNNNNNSQHRGGGGSGPSNYQRRGRNEDRGFKRFRGSREWGSDPPGVGLFHRSRLFFSPGPAIRKPEAQNNTTRTDTDSTNILEVGQEISSFVHRNPRAQMVGGAHNGTSTVTHSHGALQVDNRVGFKFGRLGVPLRGNNHRWLLVRGRSPESPSHQLVRNVCRPSVSTSVLPRREKCNCPPQVRQQVRGCVHQQVGGNPLSSLVLRRSSNMELVSGERDLDKSGISTGQRKYLGGLRVEKQQRLERLEVESESREFTLCSPPPLQCGFVCQPTQLPAGEILELEARSPSSGDGLFHPGLVDLSGLRLPAVLPGGEVYPSMCGPASENIVDSTALEKPVLVSSPPPSSPQSSNSPPTDPGSTDRPPTENTSTLSSRSIDPGRLAHLRSAGGYGELSAEAVNIISSSIRTSTRKSYQSSWGSFVRWCAERGLDPTGVSIPHILNYLSFLLNVRKLAYRSINVHRSALSYFIPPCGPTAVGEHPLVKSFMKGVFNISPPAPKHTEIWKVDQLVQYLQSQPRVEEMALKDLSVKLVCLLALSNADRSSDIKSLDLSTLKFSPEGATFSHLHLRKTSRPGFTPDSFYASYSPDSKLCVVHTLREYIERTRKLRKSSRLVISSIRPHSPVTTATIARWMLSAMASAGIDTKRFGAHSTRSASTTQASNMGVSFEEIQRCADWTSKSTFQKFYYKPRFSSHFSESILAQGSAA